jgi:hypothetical protein
MAFRSCRHQLGPVLDSGFCAFLERRRWVSEIHRSRRGGLITLSSGSRSRNNLPRTFVHERASAPIIPTISAAWIARAPKPLSL